MSYDGGEIALEVHDALRAFCEEQLSGVRVKKYLRENCGLELTAEQSNLISRQDVSGVRKLQTLLLAFAPARPPRSGFSVRDEFSIADKRRSAATSVSSPFRAGTVFRLGLSAGRRSVQSSCSLHRSARSLLVVVRAGFTIHPCSPPP